MLKHDRKGAAKTPQNVTITFDYVDKRPPGATHRPQVVVLKPNKERCDFRHRNADKIHEDTWGIWQDGDLYEEESGAMVATDGASKTADGSGDSACKFCAAIETRILKGTEVRFENIFGLENVKEVLRNNVIDPLEHPQHFLGRALAPIKGLLLYGAPGTGKTELARATATEMTCGVDGKGATFIAIAGKDLLSKWMGESSKLVGALFEVARAKEPSIIFIDECQKLLGKRDGKHAQEDASITDDFLQEMDGVRSRSTDRIFVLGATNYPEKIDSAALRRFGKSVYIPLPNSQARLGCLNMWIKEAKATGQRFDVTQEELNEVVLRTESFSGSDLRRLFNRAAQRPRTHAYRATVNNRSERHKQTIDSWRPVNLDDFKTAKSEVTATMSPKEIEALRKYASQNGGLPHGGIQRKKRGSAPKADVDAHWDELGETSKVTVSSIADPATGQLLASPSAKKDESLSDQAQDSSDADNVAAGATLLATAPTAPMTQKALRQKSVKTSKNKLSYSKTPSNLTPKTASRISFGRKSLKMWFEKYCESFDWKKASKEQKKSGVRKSSARHHYENYVKTGEYADDANVYQPDDPELYMIPWRDAGQQITFGSELTVLCGSKPKTLTDGPKVWSFVFK